MAKPARIYVWAMRDGLMFTPWDDIRVVRTRSKIILAGSPDINDLNLVQLRALVTILYGGPRGEAVFYSGNEWNKRGCPEGRRGKILKRAVLFPKSYLEP